VKKLLEESLIETFRKDWEIFTYKELAEKYKVSSSTIQVWSKDYKCKLPKPYLTKQLTKAITPQSIIEQVTKPDLNKVGIEHNEELRVCNEEFMKVLKDVSMPKREKDTLLFSIAEKAMGIYMELQPSTNRYMSCMADFYKLKLYERRVNLSDKENTEIDAATLKNLKKKFIGEAMDAICAELSKSERGMFEFLVQAATDRILLRRKKATDAMQQRAQELNGHAPSTVDMEVSA
jgi:hypothetical protein